MPKIMEIIEKETKGKSYHTYQYSYDSISTSKAGSVDVKLDNLVVATI